MNILIKSFDCTHDRSARAHSYAPAKILSRKEMARRFLLVSDSEKYQRTQLFIARQQYAGTIQYTLLINDSKSHENVIYGTHFDEEYLIGACFH